MTATRWCRTCGWKATYGSAAMADYRKRIHSCEKWIRRAESAARRSAREAAIDRTPKPCLHKEADHQHGTYACYVLDQCRCLPCTRATADYEQDRTRQQAYGRWSGLVDAAPARAHIQALLDQGMGLKQIQRQGISTGTLTKLLYGIDRPDGTHRPPAARIKPATEQKLLAVDLRLAEGARVDATGSIRRIRALVALGWSQAKLADLLGITRANFHFATGRRAQCTHGNAQAIARLYDDLSMTLPPENNHRDRIAASRARRYAKARGWLPPLGLDDERLDDPTYEPESLTPDTKTDDLDHAAIYRRTHGDKSVRLTQAEAAQLVEDWVTAGRPLNECQRITGINPQRTRRGAA